MEQVKIVYYGHACFCLEWQGGRTVLDPYGDGSVPGLPPLRVEGEAVFCSHGHQDHHFPEAVTLTGREMAPYEMETLSIPHDDAQGKKRGDNTVRIFRFGQLRVAHLGDIGRLPTREEEKALRGLDCLLLPVGGFFTIDARQAKQLLERVRPRTAIPMHYRTASSGYPVIGTLETFTRQFSQVFPLGNTLVLTKDTPEGIYVLTPAGK